MKILVVGPPHSGKSVFLGGLCQNLPRNQRYLFRACPDGEGTWTYASDDAKQYRRKGSFTDDIVGWYVNSLRNCNLAPIILVDVGGRCSEENRRIMAECDAAIILSGKIEAIAEWQDFCKTLNLEILAVLHSDYTATSDNTDGDLMVVHHLERGEDVSSRPAIQKVATIILEKISETGAKIMETPFSFINDQNVLSISELAKTLGKTEVERTLPNNKVVKQLTWEGQDLISIAELIHHRSSELPEVVKIDGASPAWLVAALSHECHPRQTALNSPDGFINVGCHRPVPDGAGLTFSVRPHTEADGWIVVEFSLNPSIPLAPGQLDEIAPPVLPMGSKVVISGRGPNWLVASLVMAYHGTTKAVACFQPGTGATVCMTHSTEVALGSMVPGNV